MATSPQPGMKKRQVIANSNRTMFLWVAAMSAVVGVCAVLAYFLFQQIIFKGQIQAQTAKTATTLKNNKQAVETLTQNLQVMETDSGLNSVKATPDEKALGVILDALPADLNPLALGASLQNKLTTDIPGLTIENITPQPVDASSVTPGQVTSLPFTLVARAQNADALKQLLAKFEKSIRTIDIDSMSVERSSNDFTMTIDAHAYYTPATSVSLGSVTCTPQKGCK